ncbi:MAG TPA: TRAP transporter large permease [Sphingomonadaceae bacterium]|nr:TRAP transporter large permease [Sphingomonadaceae bacterium]
MGLTVLLGLLFLLMAIGVPVAFALGLASLATCLVMDVPPVVAFQQMAAGMSAFSLMAIPFFIFAGDLMARAGIAERLARLASAGLGGVRGGLGPVSVGATMLFCSLSGSAVASVSAMGSTLVPLMKREGYDADYAVNVTTSAAVLGVLMPPSHNMIIYAAATGGIAVSVADLFMAGIVPGVLTAMALMVTAWIVAVRRGYPAGVFPGWRAFGRALVMALPGLFTAVIIVVGVFGGIFTPTESSAIAVVYTAIVAAAIYRTLGWRDFARAAMAAVKTTAMILLIIGTAGAFGWLLALNEAPAKLAELMALVSDDPIATLLMINIILLVLGTFMDMAPLVIITTPIFLPIAMSAGMSPVQFGVVMMLNQGIGLITPPVGTVQFVGCAIGGIPVEKAMKTIWPFYGALFLALLAVTYVPAVTLWLPEALR